MRWFAVVVLCLASTCACGSKAPTDTPAAPYTCIAVGRPDVPTAIQPRVVVVGDSYTGGSPQGGIGDKRWTAVVGSQLQGHGIDAVMKVGAEGGAGYVAHGRRTGATFADMITVTATRGDKLVVVFGSINDGKVPVGQLAHATCDTLRGAEIAAPAANLLVVGPPWVNGNPPPHLLQSRDILRTRAQELGAKFIDPIADGWFVDRPDLIGADGVHPTDAGHAYMADKLEPVIEGLLTSPPTK